MTSMLMSLLISCLGAALLLAIVLAYRTNQKWMTMLALKQGIPADFLNDGKQKQPTQTVQPVITRARMSIPIPGVPAEMRRRNEQ